MRTIFDVPELTPPVVGLPVEDYEFLTEQGRMRRNVELIRGVLVEKMSKSPLHWLVSKRLLELFMRALPPGFILRLEAPLRLADSEPEPDLAVIRGTEEEFAEQHPSTAELVVEVAVSSAAFDRAAAALYAEAGVKEYWIVLARERVAEVYTAPVAGAYTQRREVHASEILSSTAVPAISFPLGEVLFAPRT